MRLALNTTYILSVGQEQFLYERRRGDKVDFLCPETNERLSFTDEGLAEFIADRRGRLVALSERRPPAPLIANPDQRSEDDKAEAMRRFQYCLVLHKKFGTLRISNVLVDDIIARTARELGDAKPPHRTTVRTWRVQAGHPPILARLFTNNAAKGNRTDRLSSVRPLIQEKVSSFFLKRERPSVPKLHEQIDTAITIQNRDRPQDAKVVVPSLVSVYRHVERLDLRVVAEAREGRETAKRKFDQVVFQTRPEAPLDIVELDHTLADLFVVSDLYLLPIGRPWICIALDKCTTMPLGLYIGFEPPSVHTVMQTLRNAILPKRYLKHMVAEHGWKIQHPWNAFGKPRLLSIDRASENLSRDLEVFACSLGIQLHYCPGRTPHYKPDIENVLGQINRTHLQQQRGTTFSNVIVRGDYNPEKNALIRFSELQYIMHLWLIDQYARTEKSGLIDVPARLWEEKTNEFPIEPLEDVRSLDFLFGRARWFTLQTTGIITKHLQYTTPDLVALLRNPVFREAAPDRRVLCRWDPSDLSVMYIRNPISDTHLRVPAVDQDYTSNLSEYEHACIIEYRKARARSAVDRESLADTRAEMSRILQDEWKTRKGSNKRNARSIGIGRRSPAGDDAQPLLPPAPLTAAASAVERQYRRSEPTYPSDEIDIYGVDESHEDDDAL